MPPLHYFGQTYKGKVRECRFLRSPYHISNMYVCSYSAITWNHKIHGMQAISKRLCHVMNHKTSMIWIIKSHTKLKSSSFTSIQNWSISKLSYLTRGFSFHSKAIETSHSITWRHNQSLRHADSRGRHIERTPRIAYTRTIPLCSMWLMTCPKHHLI